MKAEDWIDPMKQKPPMQRFISGQGWVPSAKPYVLAVDVKGRMSVGYAVEHSGEQHGYRWTFAKPLGEPTRVGCLCLIRRQVFASTKATADLNPIIREFAPQW